jgi:asparagine synthase (glutamine-hydrolysing)
MCGICGVVDAAGRGRADSGLVRRMCSRIRHRGPDGDGYYSAPNLAMGMRRLSIIDIAGSDQPLYNEDQSLALVFNGEIYNYVELRADLIRRGHTPTTDGDGETILHLYEEYGLDLFAHLRGMYAFALWDAPRERLVLAVDHIGMKPLYLHERDGMLLFSSEAKALLADPDTPRTLNLDTLDTYLTFGYMIGTETLFAGIRRLPPGHALVVEGGTARELQHWAFGESPHPLAPSPREHRSHGEGFRGRAESDIIANARALLTDAVHTHLRSDVPLGLFLSGGVDSAAVLALMHQEAQGRIKTFTVGYDVGTGATTPDNELLHARRTAAHFSTEHHERVITAEDWWAGFERYVYHHDEPNANSSAVSLLLLGEATAREVKVVLTGLGGDELFGGYVNHRLIPWVLDAHAAWGKYLAPLGHALGALEPLYPAMKRYRYVGALPTYLPRLRQAMLPPDEALLRIQSFDGLAFSEALRRELYGADLRAHTDHKRRVFANILKRSWRDSPANTAQALVINTWLAGNALLNCDKVTMAHSLEARVPFFDPPMLAFAAQVPPELRMRSNKYVLREAMRPYLPDFALERPKQPFGTPILNWFRNELSGRIQLILRDEGAFIRDLFDRAALNRLLDGHFSGRAPQVEVVFRLLTLERWAGVFLKQAAEVKLHD